MKGKIYLINLGIYLIKDENNNFYNLFVLGVFRYKNIVFLVGDYVEFEKEKYIIKIYER